MSYQLVVEFETNKSPSTEDVQNVLRGFDPSFTNPSRDVFQSTDPITGGTLNLDLQQSNLIKLTVPYSATFRSLSAAYTLAWAIADKFAGKVRDPQLGGPPSLDLARQEWRKHETDGGLARIFGGAIPSDLATTIKQRRGMIRQEIKIRGSELEIHRKQGGRTVHYYLPLISLGPVQVSTVPNPRGISLILLGFVIIIIGLGVTGGGSAVIGGFLDLGGIAVMASSLVVYTRYKRRILAFPGQGGNLLLEAASPSKRDVEQFLSSIDRVRFAISRSQIRGPPFPSSTDSENMRVT
jgi:hypothetical protein